MEKEEVGVGGVGVLRPPRRSEQLLIQREKVDLLQMASVSGRMRTLTSPAAAMCFSSRHKLKTAVRLSPTRHTAATGWKGGESCGDEKRALAIMRRNYSNACSWICGRGGDRRGRFPSDGDSRKRGCNWSLGGAGGRRSCFTQKDISGSSNLSVP